MVECVVTIQNEAGIHCRPSSEILLTVQKFPDCVIHVESKQGTIELNSMLTLLGLGLCQGDTVTIKADGKNEEEACEAISALFAFNFDFPSNDWISLFSVAKMCFGTILTSSLKQLKDNQYETEQVFRKII